MREDENILEKIDPRALFYLSKLKVLVEERKCVDALRNTNLVRIILKS